jgi:hypothetical protein
MVEGIVAGAVVLALIAGFWFTRGAKGPRFGEARQRVWDAESRYDATGEPIGFEKYSEKPGD